MSHRKTDRFRPKRDRRVSTRRRIDLERLEDRQLLTAGTLSEYPIPWPSSQPRSIVAAPDGSLWFTDYSSQTNLWGDTEYARVGRISTAGVVSGPVQLEPYYQSADITVGPDEDLWVTELQNRQTVAQVAPVIDPLNESSPSVTEYGNFSNLNGNPYITSITRGPEDDHQFVWFADYGTDSIGRIELHGGADQPIKEFRLPADRFIVPGDGLTPGPAGDDGLYFVEEAVSAGVGSYRIGRIALDGSFTEYPPIGSVASAPDDRFSIAAGPDDAVYYARSTGRIGRLDLATGVADDNFFTVPSAVNQPPPPYPFAESLTRFPDGSLYITNPEDGTIGRLTIGPGGTVGGFFEYPKTQGRPEAVTPDHQGNPWFTEPGLGVVGTFTLPTTPLQAQPVTVKGAAGQTLSNVAVALFTDPAGPSDASQYRASIDWGDGSAIDTTATLTSTDSGSSFVVRGSHTYAMPGSYSPVVTIADLASPRTASALDSAGISIAPPAPGVVGALLATAGTPASGVLASFRAGFTDPAGYRATVDWGDGSPLGAATIETLLTPGGGPTDEVFASHSFATGGTYPGSVTVRDSSGVLTVFPIRSTVASLVAAPVNDLIAPTAGTPFGPLAVATIVFGPPMDVAAPPPTPDPRYYSATVDWGDGTGPALASAAASNNGLEIRSSGHTYASPGTYTATFTLGDAGAPGLVVGTVGIVVAGFSPGASDISATAGTPLPAGVLATLTPILSPGGPLAPDARYYSAKVDWGDGTPAGPATISGNPGGLQVQAGGHTYAAPGHYTIRYTVGDSGDPGLFVGSIPAEVQGLTATPIPVAGALDRPLAVAPDGATAVPVPLLTLTNLSPGRGDYSAAIDWGDGSPTDVGTIVPDASGTPTVRGPGHVYDRPGSFRIDIRIGTAGDPGLAAFSTTATIVEAPIAVTGALDPASDSGVSDLDGITNVVTPTFDGLTAPGASVQIYAHLAIDSTRFPILIGRGVAGPDGRYSITTIRLLDGDYTVDALAIGKGGTVAAFAPIETPAHPLVIDTVPPRVVGFAVTNARLGRFQVSFGDDRSGLVTSGMVSGSAYDVRRPGSGQKLVVSGLSATPGPSPTRTVTVKGSLSDGRRPGMIAGQYAFTIEAAGITDLAGNALDGTFLGRLPTGDGRPGGDFQARVVVRGDSASAPIPLTTGRSVRVAAVKPAAPARVKIPAGKG